MLQQLLLSLSMELIKGIGALIQGGMLIGLGLMKLSPVLLLSVLAYYKIKK